MQIPLHSAYTGFFLVLSLFPGLLLLLGTLRYTPLEVKDLMELLEGFLPESLLPLVNSLISASYKHASKTVVTISVLGTLFSASRGMFGIRNGLDAIYQPTRRHGSLGRRGISVVHNISFLLALLLTLVLYLAVTGWIDYLWMATHPVTMTLLRIIDLRSIFLLLMQTALFCGMYAFLPGRRNSISQSLPGAAIASLLWLLFSWLFSIYVEHFTAYTNIYGSIYALALGMLWLYLSISIFFYGAALNRYLAERPN